MLYQEVYDASRGNNAVIIGCNTIGHLGAGLMHLNRTGDDTSGRIWERTKRMGVNTLAFRLPQHNTFYHIDADCVGIFGKIPWDKNLQWADLLAKSGTPLFVSAMPGALNPEEFEELHQIMLSHLNRKSILFRLTGRKQIVRKSGEKTARLLLMTGTMMKVRPWMRL